MRPLRALGGLLALVGLWLVWRAPTIRADYARLISPAKHAPPIASRQPAATPQAMLAEATPPARRDADGSARPSLQPPILRRLPSPASVQPVEIAVSDALPSSTLLPAPTVVATTEEPAALGYRALAAGNRRAAAAAFRIALAEAPDDARAEAWRMQLAGIEKRWSASAYILVRDSTSTGLSAAPVLGGGQSGVQVGYFLDPLTARPMEIISRLTAPNTAVREGSQAAVGASWHVLPALTITAERLVAIGIGTRNSWTLRAAGGLATQRQPGRRIWLDASAYAEAGAVGLHRPATYGALQGRIGGGLAVTERLAVTAGGGLWTSNQHDRRNVGRLEIGPTLRARSGQVEIAADYRFRLAGNAAPGSGPALTLSSFF